MWVQSAWLPRAGAPSLGWAQEWAGTQTGPSPIAPTSGVRHPHQKWGWGGLGFTPRKFSRGREIRKFSSPWFDVSWILSSQNKLVPPKFPPLLRLSFKTYCFWADIKHHNTFLILSLWINLLHSFVSSPLGEDVLRAEKSGARESLRGSKMLQKRKVGKSLSFPSQFHLVQANTTPWRGYWIFTHWKVWKYLWKRTSRPQFL